MSISFLTQAPAWALVVWSVLGVVAVIGLIALISPKGFASLAHTGGRWVDTNRLVERLDRRVDVDQLVLPYSRFLGLAVVAAVGVIGYFVLRFLQLS